MQFWPKLKPQCAEAKMKADRWHVVENTLQGPILCLPPSSFPQVQLVAAKWFSGWCCTECF